MIRNHDVDTSMISSSEDAIKQFESAWQQGHRPKIVDYLNTKPDKRLHLLVELVHIDLEFRFRHKETPQVEHYLKEHPELVANAEFVIEFICAEYHLRQRNGYAVSEKDYLQRFPQYREKLEGQLLSPDSTLSWPRRLTVLPPRQLPQIPGFELDNEIGHGGMGVVYRARQPALHRVVAIKTLIHGIASTTGLKERFRHEAESIARLDHPQIVPVYEVGEWTPDGATTTIPYFVMKYYSGGSLAHVKSGPGTDPERHARMVETIAQAVHHAHQRGILHRDLKPSNILLDEQGEPHVVDFGLAGRFDPDDPQSMTATVMGTPAYMAPEQARSPSHVTTAADVYGLGAILYQLLTGQPPFRAETPLAVLDLVTHRNPIRPSLLNPAVPKDIETICLKCLEKDPSQRYESSAALASDLERHRTGRSILARPSPAWERAWRIIRRHPIITFLMIMTFAVLITALAVVALSYLRMRDQEQETKDALQRERWANAELINTVNREQKLLYGKRISTIGRLWASNQLPQAWAELDACPEKYRGWEWRYFNSLRGKTPTTISTPESVIRGVGFLSDDQIVTGDSRGVVTIWDWKKKTPLHTWQGSATSVRALAVYPLKKWFAVCDQDNLTVWNYETREKLAYLPGSVWVAFSPDGKYLASTHTNDAIQSRDVMVWDTSTWKQLWLLKGHKSFVLNGTISPDSKTLVTCSTDRTVRRWNLIDGKEEGEPWKRALPTFRLAYLPDGRHLAEAQPSAMLWTDMQTGKELGRCNMSTLAQPTILTARVQITTGPDPAIIAVSGPSHDVQLWDIRRNRSIAMFRGHNLFIGALEFSPDGKRIVTASNDQTVCIWEIDHRQEYRSTGKITTFVHDTALSASGRFVAVIPNYHSTTKGTDQVSVVSLTDDSEVRQFKGVGTATFIHDAMLVTAQGDGGVICWDLKTSKPVWQHEAPQQRCVSLTTSSDGKTVTLVQMDGTIKRLDHATGQVIDEQSVLRQILSTVGVSVYLNRLAFVGEHGVELWDLTSHSMQTTFPMNGTRKVVFSPNGECVATAEADRVIRLRNAKTGSLILTFPGHPRTINSIEFSADGKRIVSSCADGLIRLWDTETGVELVTLPGQFEESILVTWDHTHDQIIAVDTKVHIWQAPQASSEKE